VKPVLQVVLVEELRLPGANEEIGPSSYPNSNPIDILYLSSSQRSPMGAFLAISSCAA